MKALTFTVPDGPLKREYRFPLPAAVVPRGAEYAEKARDGSAVFRDNRGLFQLVVLGEQIQRRPYVPLKPKKKGKK